MVLYIQTGACLTIEFLKLHLIFNELREQMMCTRAQYLRACTYKGILFMYMRTGLDLYLNDILKYDILFYISHGSITFLKCQLNTASGFSIFYTCESDKLKANNNKIIAEKQRFINCFFSKSTIKDL